MQLDSPCFAEYNRTFLTLGRHRARARAPAFERTPFYQGKRKRRNVEGLLKAPVSSMEGLLNSFSDMKRDVLQTSVLVPDGWCTP